MIYGEKTGILRPMPTLEDQAREHSDQARACGLPLYIDGQALGVSLLCWLSPMDVLARGYSLMGDRASVHFNVGVAKPVPALPLNELQQIAAKAERRLSVIDELDATVQANLTRAERLRQAILQQAFSGRLLSAKVSILCSNSCKGTATQLSSSGSCMG